MIKLALTARRAPGLAAMTARYASALARTDTGMCDFCTVKQQRHAGGVA